MLSRTLLRNGPEVCLLEAMQLMQRYHQYSCLHRTKAFLQYVHNLTGRAQDPKILAGEIVTHQDETCLSDDDKSIIYVRHVLGADLAFMFSDHEMGQQHVVQTRRLNFAPKAYMCVVDRFKEALICIARARINIDKKKNKKTAIGVLHQMRKWASHCRENFLNKQCLVEAELKTLHTHTTLRHQILSLYDQSIEAAVRENFVQEAALACELRGDYLSRQGERILATAFWDKAHALYLKWGATEKVAHLVQLKGTRQAEEVPTGTS